MTHRTGPRGVRRHHHAGDRGCPSADGAPQAVDVPAAEPALPERHATGSAEPAPPQLYTPAEAAGLLTVRESWLRRKAAARAVPCTFLGKHLRFSAADLAAIAAAAARPALTGPAATRRRHPR
ncbi:hypothetical protein [Pseudonocardia sp.]|uniref:hypothetical protein n=1 Tax=Pseudonocardia sp. TaxID=60912 RepID=UPI003D0D3C11